MESIAYRAAANRSTSNCDVIVRSEEHTSELQSHLNLVCRLLLEKKNQAYHSVATRAFQGQLLEALVSVEAVFGSHLLPLAPRPNLPGYHTRSTPLLHTTTQHLHP